MDDFTKSINKLENYIAKYIYKKYIEIDLDANIVPDIKYKYSRKPINQDDYNKFLHSIFSVERKSLITQSESIDEELKNISIADTEFEKNPKKFRVRQFKSLPDIKRCSFIRYYKNKYKRCKSCVLNNNSDMCYKHKESINMYWDNYCSVIEKKT